jgi:hypothetical protein
MMGPGTDIREAWVILPVLALFLVGGVIALHSEAQRPDSGWKPRQVAASLSRLLLRVLGYVAVLLALQSWVGLGHSPVW